MRREKLIRLALESKKVLVLHDPLAKVTILKRGSISIGLCEAYPVRMDVRADLANRMTYNAAAKLLELKE